MNKIMNKKTKKINIKKIDEQYHGQNEYFRYDSRYPKNALYLLTKVMSFSAFFCIKLYFMQILRQDRLLSR